MAKKKLSFEEAMARLENVVAQMENPDTSLADSVNLYKEGLALSVFCGESLHTIEKEVLILKQNAEGVFEQKVFENSEME